MTTWLFFASLGIGTGAIYAAFSVSVIVAYRGSGVVNFAVGAMAMIPAMTFAELRLTGDLVLPIIVAPHRFSLGDTVGATPAFAIALAVGLLVAAVTFALVIRPLRGAPPVTMLVATVGLSLVLQAIAVKNFGNQTLRAPSMLPRDVTRFLGRAYPIDRVWMLGVVIVVAGGVLYTYRATRFGLATRAAFLNEKGAVLLGFAPARLGLANWMFAAGVGGVVGIIGSSLGGVSPFNFSLFVVPALGAALAARLKSIPVAVGAAVAIGSFEAIAVHIVAQRQVPRFFLGGISSLVPFVVVVLALILVGRALPRRDAILERAHVPVPLKRIGPVAWAITIGVGVLTVLSSDQTVRFAAMETLFVTTLLLSVVVLTGFVGQVSLAQLSFAGFSAFMLSRFDTALPFPFGPVAAVVVTTVVGTVVGIPALRVRGIQFAVLTFSLAVVFDELLFRSPTFVGGGGLAVVESPSLFGFDIGIFGSGEFPQRRFGLALLVTTVLCAALVVGVRRGSLGRQFLAIRSNERAAAASGINVAATKVKGAAISAFVASVAGVMFAYKATTFNGGGLGAQEGLQLVALGYLGGIGSITGAVIGGALAPSGLFVVVLLGGGSTIDQFLATGVGLIVVAVKFPSGLAGIPALLRARAAGINPVDDDGQDTDGRAGPIPDGDISDLFQPIRDTARK